MKNWINRQFRKKSRIYILPTKLGGYLIGLIFLMFLLAVGYANNLLLIFTIFLFGFNLLWLIKTHFYLSKLKILQVSVASGYAKSPLSVCITLKSAPELPWDWRIVLESDRGDLPFQQIHEDQDKLEGNVRPSVRGLYRWQHIKIKTERPFGLYQVWIYFPLNFETVVYPALLSYADLAFRGERDSGDVTQERKGSEDFRGLVQYAQDESRKISWKHYARTGDLLVKEGEEKSAATVEFHFNPPSDLLARENYLSKMATQMTECYRTDIPFSFESGTFSKRHSSQGPHLQECLKVLALC